MCSAVLEGLARYYGGQQRGNVINHFSPFCMESRLSFLAILLNPSVTEETNQVPFKLFKI